MDNNSLVITLIGIVVTLGGGSLGYLKLSLTKLEEELEVLRKENTDLRSMLFKAVIGLKSVVDPTLDRKETVKIADQILAELERLK